MANSNKVDYGRLISFSIGANTIQFGGFSNSMIDFASGLGDLARGIYYYADEDGKPGSGRLSKGMAQSALRKVKEVWADKGSGLRSAAGVKSSHKSKYYAKWKQEAFGETRTRVLTGTSLARVKLIKGYGSWSIGIDKRYAALKYVIGARNAAGKGVRRLAKPARRVNASMYNDQLEFESGYYRLVGPAINLWLQKESPAWASVFNTYMNNFYAAVAKQEKIKQKTIVQTKTGNIEDIIKPVSSSVDFDKYGYVPEIEKAAKDIKLSAEQLLNVAASRKAAQKAAVQEKRDSILKAGAQTLREKAMEAAVKKELDSKALTPQKVHVTAKPLGEDLSEAEMKAWMKANLGDD